MSLGHMCLLDVVLHALFLWELIGNVSLQNVPPAVLVRFLREHRSEWADFSVDAYSAAALKAGSYAFSGMRATRFTGSQIIMPLGHTIENEEVCIFSLVL